MTQDDWFNFIFPIIIVIMTIALIRGYYQEKRYHENIENEHLKLAQEKVALQKEISEFNATKK